MKKSPLIELRYNEVKDLLDINDILYVESNHWSIQMDLPKIGPCTYWKKKDLLHDHKNNKWISQGHSKIKSLLNK